MKDLLTQMERDLLQAYADYDMKVRPAAEAVHCDRRTAYRMFEHIYLVTGYNPQDFWDLFKLMSEIRTANEER